MGDLVLVQAGQMIPGDGEIVEGAASVNEAAITGESAPVIRAAGGDRSGVTGGTVVLSDRIVVRITSGAGDSFLDKMIGLVEGAIRQRSPNEIALTLVLSAFSLAFLIVVVALWPMAWNAEQYMKGYIGLKEPLRSLGTDVPTLIALLVCRFPSPLVLCLLLSESQAWIALSRLTLSPRAEKQWKWPATLMWYCWIRHARSP